MAAVVFEMRRLEKLNIQIFLFCFKTMEMQRGYKFVSGKMFSGIKVIFLEFCSICFNGIVMTRSILKRKFL